MENPGLLNWRRWWSTRRAPIIAAAVAFSGTIALLIANVLYKHEGEGNQMDFFLLLSWGLSLWPAVTLAGIFGWKVEIDMTVGKESSWITPTLFAAAVNCALAFLIVHLTKKAIDRLRNLVL